MPRNDPGSPDPVPAANVADLVRAARVGDREAFGQLVTLHQSAVTRLAYRLLGDMDEADGAAQDAFIRAWSRLGEFRDECPFAAWLSRITINQCRDRLRRRRFVLPEGRLGTREGANPLETVVDPTPGPEARAAGRGIGRTIAELTQGLPGMQREVFALRYYDDRSLVEIAALFRVNVGTIKTHLFRATRRIRKSLEALYG